MGIFDDWTGVTAINDAATAQMEGQDRAIDALNQGAIYGIDALNTASGQSIAAQQQALEQSLAAQQQGYSGAQAAMSPYMQAGTGALSQQQAMSGALGPEAQQQAYDAIQNSAGFQASLAQGENSILQNSSATGGLRGGNTQGALAQYSPAMLSAAIDQRYSQLGGLSDMGMSASGQMANASMGLGQSLGSSYMGTGQGMSNTYMGTGQNLANTYMGTSQGIANANTNQANTAAQAILAGNQANSDTWSSFSQGLLDLGGTLLTQGLEAS